MLVHTCCVWLLSAGPMAYWVERKEHQVAGGREHRGVGSMGGGAGSTGWGVGSTGGWRGALRGLVRKHDLDFSSVAAAG